MKKFLLYFLLAAFCTLFLTSITFASGTIAKDDGIRGAPPGIAVQQDREGSYAAPFTASAQPSIETAFLPQTPVQVASANENLIDADKGAVAVVDDTAIATRSEVMPLVAKDFLASSFVSDKEIKLANAPMTIVAHTTPATIPMTIVAHTTQATIPMKEGMAPLAIKPIMSSSFVKSDCQYRV